VRWFMISPGWSWTHQGLSASVFFFFFAVLGFELRAYTLSHSASPFWCWFFFFLDKVSLTIYLPGLALNHNLPDLCLLGS
jgi:hypothetical protein